MERTIEVANTINFLEDYLLQLKKCEDTPVLADAEDLKRVEEGSGMSIEKYCNKSYFHLKSFRGMKSAMSNLLAAKENILTEEDFIIEIGKLSAEDKRHLIPIFFKFSCSLSDDILEGVENVVNVVGKIEALKGMSGIFQDIANTAEIKEKGKNALKELQEVMDRIVGIRDLMDNVFMELNK